MAILLKGCKPDNLESHNSQKLRFTNIQGVGSNFVKCESFLESNSCYSCSVWDKLGWLNWFWQFLYEGLSSQIQKESVTHMHGLAVYVKTAFCMGLISRKLRILTYVFEWLNYTQYLTPFSSINHLLCLCAQFLIIFHLTWWGSVDHSIC